MRNFAIGFIVALLLPFAIDWALFGTPTPQHPVKCDEVIRYHDGAVCEIFIRPSADIQQIELNGVTAEDRI